MTTGEPEENPASELFAAIVRGDVDDAVARVTADPELAHAREAALGSTPLIFAAHRGQTAVVAALLRAGADVQAREAASDTTALHWAAEIGEPAIVEPLLGRGAPLEARDRWFELTPLGWATVVRWAPHRHRDRPAAARALRAAGAADDIFVALTEARADAVRSLCRADPQAMARRLGFVAGGMTPLHLAVARGLRGALPLLIELGADLRAHTDDGLTPFALALARGDAAMIASLRALGAADDAASALVTGDLAGFAARLESGAAAPELLARWLALAARNGSVEAIALLLRHGAGVDARTRRLLGETPADVTALHLAALAGHADAVRALLDAGAAVDGRAGPGLPTPLHMAAGEGHLEAARALLERGASRDAVDDAYASTPLQWAEFAGHEALVALLSGA